MGFPSGANKIALFEKAWLQRWLVGLWQCVQCECAIVLKNVQWAKNKKHRVGMSVGIFVLSIFLFSVLSQWFTFQFYYCRCLFTLGGYNRITPLVLFRY